MKEKRTGESSAQESSDWERLRSLTDRQVRRAIESDPETPPTDAEFWKKARVVIPAASKPLRSGWMQTFSNG
jgi:hypothetical protein